MKSRLTPPTSESFDPEAEESRYADHAHNIATIIAAALSAPTATGGELRTADEAVDLYLERVGEDIDA